MRKEMPGSTQLSDFIVQVYGRDEANRMLKEGSSWDFSFNKSTRDLMSRVEGAEFVLEGRGENNMSHFVSPF